MRFKVEIEARLANFELWNRIPSTLVFNHFSLKNHAFASLLSIHFSKNLAVFRPPTYSLCEADTSMLGLGMIRWSVRGSNPRPPACKAGALPAELTPQKVSRLPSCTARMRWAWKDLNFRPHAYQACALTN
jgi:hypothetical protein